MKQALKIISIIFSFLGVIALIVCHIIIPTETLLAEEKVMEWLNTPIAIAGLTTTLGVLLLYFIIRYIFTETSLGKKNLKALEDKVDSNSRVETANINELRKEYENNRKTDIEESNKMNDRLKITEKALQLIPNKKVQEALKNGREKDNKTTSE